MVTRPPLTPIVWARVCPSCRVLNTVKMMVAKPAKVHGPIKKYTCGNCGALCPLPLVTPEQEAALREEYEQ